MPKGTTADIFRVTPTPPEHEASPPTPGGGERWGEGALGERRRAWEKGDRMKPNDNETPIGRRKHLARVVRVNTKEEIFVDRTDRDRQVPGPIGPIGADRGR